MAYRNTKTFSPAKMGTKAGWCLMNCRLGFGIDKGTYPSALADMGANKRAGTLHDISSLPTNCAVPVYLDTASKYEHVIVADHGVYYSDGKRLSSLSGLKVFGWGESCDGVRVVEYVADPQPIVNNSDLPARGYLKFGDNTALVGKICDFYAKWFWGYFCRNYNTAFKQLRGNYFGQYCLKWTKEFQRRTDLVQDGYIGPLTLAMLRKYGLQA